MNAHPFASVWEAIEDTPEEAATMKLCASLMRALQAQIADHGLSPTEAARRFGVTEPRIAELIAGKVTLFDLNALIHMAATAGLQCEIQIRDAA
ncbi:helix-turn-helix domain-containing protein [Halochromatium salexigens]|uniref:Transcriptional regulator n=1 Tax=Halochromatium salexigens TaxID=49447 RepID=A0AAJ0UEE3_HALSE|nr:XRE family transcriptional regulator [Halochromatium salexigens]MBK5929907.1 transcriptional regulator [Halochromatium salexigens]